MNCGSAAKSNNEILCSNCGEMLVEVEAYRCKACGSEVESDSAFCRKCGTKVGEYADVNADIYEDTSFYRDSIEPTADTNNKPLVIALIALLILCAIATTAMCMVLFKKDDSPVVSEKDTPSTISETSENDSEDSDAKESIPVSEPEDDYEEADKPKEPESKNEPEAPQKEEPDASSSQSTVLGDYDPDSNDWYRLRKAKNDPSTQIGAYKTLSQALAYAETYVPQGYVLYDKDFNVINIYNYVSSSTTKNTRTETYTQSAPVAEEKAETTTSPYDYAPNSNDWYRLRKVKNDPSTQIGAYKTLEAALSYAEIYRSQGYVLYDKDFNVIG